MEFDPHNCPRKSSAESKRMLITSWVRTVTKSNSNIVVSDYSYSCFFTGKPVTKTLIAFPNEMDSKRIVAIDKRMEDVELADIIKLCPKLKQIEET